MVDPSAPIPPGDHRMYRALGLGAFPLGLLWREHSDSWPHDFLGVRPHECDSYSRILLGTRQPLSSMSVRAAAVSSSGTATPTRPTAESRWTTPAASAGAVDLSSQCTLTVAASQIEAAFDRAVHQSRDRGLGFLYRGQRLWCVDHPRVLALHQSITAISTAIAATSRWAASTPQRVRRLHHRSRVAAPRVCDRWGQRHDSLIDTFPGNILIKGAALGDNGYEVFLSRSELIGAYVDVRGSGTGVDGKGVVSLSDSMQANRAISLDGVGQVRGVEVRDDFGLTSSGNTPNSGFGAGPGGTGGLARHQWREHVWRRAGTTVLSSTCAAATTSCHQFQPGMAVGVDHRASPAFPGTTAIFIVDVPFLTEGSAPTIEVVRAGAPLLLAAAQRAAAGQLRWTTSGCAALNRWNSEQYRGQREG